MHRGEHGAGCWSPAAEFLLEAHKTVGRAGSNADPFDL